MEKILVWSPQKRNPIKKNETLTVRSHGVEFRNTGAVKVTIDKFWVLEPDETKFFGFDNPNVVLDHVFSFDFATNTTNDPQSVAVVEIKIKNFNYENCV